MPVESDSHLTLHYRLTLLDTGDVVFDTFGGKPATIQVGAGQLAAPLEQRLLGLPEGAEARFELAAEAAFGARNPELVQRVSRAMLERHGEAGERYEPGDVIEFPAPGGGRYSGVLKSLDAAGAVFDFNHPFAGRPLALDVRIIGIL